MRLAHVLPLAAIVAASLATGLVLAFVIRARRLNAADLCGVCARLLPLELRFRFHGRSVCPACSRRLRHVAIPRIARILLLLVVWTGGAAAVIAMILNHEPEARFWGPLFAMLVLLSLLVGALPAPVEREDHTATTLERRHAFLTGKPSGRASAPDS